MIEIDLLEHLLAGSRRTNHDVVLSDLGIHFQRRWHRCHSLPSLNELHLYRGTGILLLYLVGARVQLRSANLHGIRNIH